MPWWSKTGSSAWSATSLSSASGHIWMESSERSGISSMRRVDSGGFLQNEKCPNGKCPMANVQKSNGKCQEPKGKCQEQFLKHGMTRQVLSRNFRFFHATSGKKMSKGDFILFSGANFYEVNYLISELLRKMK